jgi:hypothetical protein
MYVAKCFYPWTGQSELQNNKFITIVACYGFRGIVASVPCTGAALLRSLATQQCWTALVSLS